MEFFIEEYNSCKEFGTERKVDTIPKLLDLIKELKKQEGEDVYYQVFVKDMYGNYMPIDFEIHAIRWEEEW